MNEQGEKGLRQEVSAGELKQVALWVGVALLGLVLWQLYGKRLPAFPGMTPRPSAAVVTLRGLAVAPNPDTLESSEGGLSVYRLGDTELASVTTLSSWTATDWWVKLEGPKVKRQVFGKLDRLNDNGIATQYRISSGPLEGGKLVETRSGEQMSIWSPEYVRKRP
ncbi:hypothetical protein [Deinococcus wulumuqiensis]|uniref:hypothetical protein n=1 Tax=Deinococcus wulumuqiensis TaxID=980427 RepID=UPI00242B1334|nr:hypothetical protein [Deinococcus wulumuqiensis]